MNELATTYQDVMTRLNYKSGLVEDESVESRSALQHHLFLEAKRLGETKPFGCIDAVYFAGEVPLVYFKRLNRFNEEHVKELHRLVWSQNRVPFLYVVTPGELRIYNGFQKPTHPAESHLLDDEERLIDHFKLASATLEDLKRYSHEELSSGAFWKTETGNALLGKQRADQVLLKNLREARRELHNQGLSYPTIHNLLGRSIFIMYLEDREVTKPDYFSTFKEKAEQYADVLEDKKATYGLFDHLHNKFNGDLFPITPEERREVELSHLRLVRELLLGTELMTGQRRLWRPYDFSAIPIELISAIYENFLHKEEGKESASEAGAFYTPQMLVEFILNEVLPWPSQQEHEYEKRILDPTCGSGIFLVEAFRRLVARWKYSHSNSVIPREELSRLLTQNIFGIDNKEEAIKVAAFSLYLALLNYLEPKEIWREFQFPYLVYRADSSSACGSNLFPTDALSDGPFEQQEYDIVVGNPPWKRDGLSENVSKYCRDRGFAQEAAQAFLWRARDFVDEGKIALLSTSKVLFNSEAPDQHFRTRFFEENYVETVVNFSAIRKARVAGGRQLFSSATGPGAVLFYRKKAPDIPAATILYCTPKPSKALSVLPGIVIDASEIKFIPREKAKGNIIWKAALWGTKGDFEILERLIVKSQKSLEGRLKELPDWHYGRGLQKPGSGSKRDQDIAKLPIVPTEYVRRYFVSPTDLKEIGTDRFDRLGGEPKVYYAPHILLKRGLQKRRLCAAYVDFDCAFKDSIIGIAAKGFDPLLKAITAYINSAFATYYLFLSSSQWGVERDRINQSEILGLPDIPFRLEAVSLLELARKVDAISERIASGMPEDGQEIQELEAQIDKIIYDSLDLTDSERFLIDDVLRYSIDYFHRGENSVACDEVSGSELQVYSSLLCKRLNSVLKFGESRASAVVYDGASPLRLVSVYFDSAQHNNGVRRNARLDEELSRLDKALIDDYSESIYVRRHFKSYEENALHIVKPAEKRFWIRSMALNDAGEILAEGINPSKEYVRTIS